MSLGRDRRVVIDGAYGHRNLGDELILRGLLATIGQPPERVSVMTADPVDTCRRHHTHALHRESRYRRRGARRASPRALLWAIGAVARAHVYVIGGGALITDERGLLPLARLVALSSVARATGVPTVVLGISVGPLETAAGRSLARRLLSGAELILTRDPGSHALAGALVGGERVRLCPDLALLAPFHPVEGVALELRRRAVAVAVRDVPPSRSFRDRDAQRTSMVTNLARLLDAFVERCDADVVFIPFQTLPSSGLEERLDDVSVSRAVIAAMTHASRASVVAIADELELRAALSGYRVVLAQRFHAGIVALAAETPLVTLAYHEKFAGVGGRHGGTATTRDVIAGEIAPALAAVAAAWESSETAAHSEGRRRARAAIASAAGVRAMLTVIRPCNAVVTAPPRRPPATRP